MPKLTRIYTRTGDDGTTGLVGGRRIRKDALRIEAYGTVDELSSSIGLARTALAYLPAGASKTAVRIARDLDRWLAWTQDVLFNLGCELATLPEDRKEGMPRLSPEDAAALERSIDRAQSDLEPLANFIHPGGSYPGAVLHQSRTVARRAERLIVMLAEGEPVSPDARRYVNRLSDALFVWSRWINHALGRAEHLWDPNASPPTFRRVGLRKRIVR
jgi:cob(I)alamin adenosyltransferase